MIDNAKITVTGLGFNDGKLVGGLQLHSANWDATYFADFTSIDDIKSMLEVVGVDTWEGMRDSYVRADFKMETENSGKVIGIGNIIDSKWHYISTGETTDPAVEHVEGEVV